MNSSGSSVSDFQVDRIDVGKALEQHRLAFHHRLGRERPEVAEAEDRRAVGDDRDHVAAHRVVINGRRIGGDRLDRSGDARRIGKRQVALRRHRLGRHDLELAGTPARVELERLLIGDRGAFAWSVGRVSHGSYPCLAIRKWKPECLSKARRGQLPLGAAKETWTALINRFPPGGPPRSRGRRPPFLEAAIVRGDRRFWQLAEM